MSEYPQAQSWWLASDGKWYPPEQASQPLSPIPSMPAADQPPPSHDGLAGVTIGAFVACVVLVAVVGVLGAGGLYLTHRNPTWSDATRKAFVASCVSNGNAKQDPSLSQLQQAAENGGVVQTSTAAQGVTEESCGCSADKLAADGITEERAAQINTVSEATPSEATLFISAEQGCGIVLRG